MILDIPALIHLSCKLRSNVFNGTTTTVVPDFWLWAGNWNNKLLPAPVPMITTTGLTFCMILVMASSCLPLNVAPSPTILFNSAWISTVRNRFHRAICASCISSSGVPRFRFNSARGGSWLDVKCKNRCHTSLTFRN
ncbi:hypothetical protein BJ878DRAFT_428922 [Calycina marina]|uniref:Uncharacterized protein n=1 Tax=Calycina marina TaxID=1763456 RepID=A0A9P8CBY5_9HELO|nr:hypothetical protein BJ878DRAFT_428922 [Calycina marina]